MVTLQYQKKPPVKLTRRAVCELGLVSDRLWTLRRRGIRFRHELNGGAIVLWRKHPNLPGINIRQGGVPGFPGAYVFPDQWRWLIDTLRDIVLQW